jgi:hypothetical protein
LVSKLTVDLMSKMGTARREGANRGVKYVAAAQVTYSNLNMQYSYLSTGEAGNRTVTAVCFIATLPTNALLPQL